MVGGRYQTSWWVAKENGTLRFSFLFLFQRGLASERRRTIEHALRSYLMEPRKALELRWIGASIG